jgi:hypothetical protein
MTSYTQRLADFFFDLFFLELERLADFHPLLQSSVDIILE